MSKEEILGPHIFDVDNWNEGVLKSDAYEAMDKYAEQESISFAEWTAQSSWKWDVFRKHWMWVGLVGKNEGIPVKTTAELYTLFKQQSKH